MLLTRDAFREAVFLRDEYKCVVCGGDGDAAHHIMERRLWPDGGYYVDNGATVCEECHLLCEDTTISPAALRQILGINPILPPHLYDDQEYDKWGNIILPNGARLRGELFYDESVQKVLRTVLHTFSDKVKYPRTYHLPWSESVSKDDRVITDLSRFEGNRVIVTEKMDGENTSMYQKHIHARSVDSARHNASRSWVKNLWSQLGWELPHDWRVCGENLFAKHSIGYNNLPSFFLGFSLWTEGNVCADWDSTLEYFDLLGIEVVPVLYDGLWDEKVIRNLPIDRDTSEGYVVRVADKFSYGDFRHSVAKFVRKGHASTVKHWFHGQPIVPNQIR